MTSSVHTQAQQRQEGPDQRATSTGAIVQSNRYPIGIQNQSQRDAETFRPISVSPTRHLHQTQGQQRPSKGPDQIAATSSGILFAEFRPTTVDVYMGDILNVNADAVVSPSNSRLHNQGGVAAAIANAAGQRLIDQCAEFIRLYGQLPTTNVTHTTAGNLSHRFGCVMHVAGPRRKDYPNVDNLIEVMRRTFERCLRYANDTLKVKSICIPAIGSGEIICNFV